MVMDMSDGVEEVGGGCRSGGPLVVTRASSKIGKGLRRPVAQPRPQIYKTEPCDFRSLVQQLTGTSSASGALEPGPAQTKPAVSRLQKIAPPPLRPTVAYASLPQQPQSAAPTLPAATTAPGFSPFPFGGFLPLSSQWLSPSPPSFSPLPVLTPSDQVRASSLSPLESPKAGIQQQQLEESERGEKGNVLRQESVELNAPVAVAVRPASRFSTPLSPKFAIPFGLPSPIGLGGFGMFGMSSTFSPAAAFAKDATFSFAEPDISLSSPTMP